MFIECRHDSFIARVQPVHLMNVKQRQAAAAEPHTKPTDLNCEDCCLNLQLLFSVSQPES